MSSNQKFNKMHTSERAACYNFLSILLANPLKQNFKKQLLNTTKIMTNDSELEQSLIKLAHSSNNIELKILQSNFNDLFISIGEPILKPYASYYLTGFLYEKPLAQLRSEMSRLGLKLNPDISEPEDHISSLFETMSFLVSSEEYLEKTHEHRIFFEHFLNSWVMLFFQNLEDASKDDFYKELAVFGKIFINSEKFLFEL